MDTNSIKLYIELNKILAKTITIKSKISADTINDYLILTKGKQAVDLTDPTSWKYYLNISGEYHTTDQRMLITSLDTLETIEFNKSNLAKHITTSIEYQYGTRYYNTLINKYPLQEQLILGILYPANITKAINSDSGTVLSYNKNLVEPQEATLIQDLEIYLKNFLARWDVSAFGISDSFYNSAQHAIFYLSIFPKLLNLRLKRCKTSEAHSFHITEYLKSHNKLNRFIPYMTLKQILFLYRNILYIEKNSGKSKQFSLLVEKLLSDRHIPINELSIRKLLEFDENYDSVVHVRRKAINAQYNSPEIDFITLDELRKKESNIVYGSDNYYSTNEDKITKKIINSKSSVIQTKDLESVMVDYSDSVPDPLESVLLREWVTMAHNDQYPVIITFKDPKTSEERSLTTISAFIYMYYITLMSANINVDKVPYYINIKQRKRTKPSLSDLLSVTSSEFTDMSDIAQDILDKSPLIGRTISVKNFYKLGYKIFDQLEYQRRVISSTEDLYKRAQVDNMVLQLYEDKKIVFDDYGQNINDWLVNNNLPAYNYSMSQANELIKNIFAASTGLFIDETKVLKNIQKALINTLSILTSYSVQYIVDINNSAIKPTNWSAVRAGNLKYSISYSKLLNLGIRVNDCRIKSKRSIKLDNYINVNYINSLKVSSAIEIPYDFKSIIKFKTNDIRKINCYFNSFTINFEYDNYDSAVSNKSGFVGFENYLALTDQQKLQIKSIYPIN